MLRHHRLHQPVLLVLSRDRTSLVATEVATLILLLVLILAVIVISLAVFAATRAAEVHRARALGCAPLRVRQDHDSLVLFMVHW